MKDRLGNNQNRSPRALRLSVRNRNRSGTAGKTQCTGFDKLSVPRKGDEDRAGRQKAPPDDAGRLASIQKHDRMPRLQRKPGKSRVPRLVGRVPPQHRQVPRSKPKKVLVQGQEGVCGASERETVQKAPTSKTAKE